MQYDLVFEGGGAKGMAFVGAVRALNDVGSTFDRVMGASAGAIAATFLAAGYEPDEMMIALAEKRDGKPVFLQFLGEPAPLSREEIAASNLRQLLRDVNLKAVPDFMEERFDDALVGAIQALPYGQTLLSFLERGGIYSAQQFVSWMEEKLDSGVYNRSSGELPVGSQRQFSHMTLAEFHRATGVELSLIASDITGAQMLVLNHRTAPACPLVMAVRMSMSFPFLWQEVTWQSEWGPYRGKDLAGHAVVDGGLLSNFPIELFISDLQHVTDVMGPRRTEQVLGFLIDESKVVPAAPPAGPEEPPSLLGKVRTVQRLRQFVDTVTQAHDKMVIDAFSQLVVRLPAKGYGTIEFEMSDERRDLLIAAAQQATEAHFQQAAAALDLGMLEGAKGIELADPQQMADDIATKLLAE